MDSFLSFYLILSTVVCFAYMMRIPSKMTRANNFVGSLVSSVGLGWLIWPFVVVKAVSVRRS